MTDYIDRIDQLITETDDFEVRARLFSSKACYLARIGRAADAQAIVSDLRHAFRVGSSASPLAWAMLVEGLISYFTSLGGLARDRVHRSFESSRVLRVGTLSQVCAAWLAHLDFEEFRFVDMEARAIYVVSSDLSTNPEAAVRIGLVMGDAHLYAGDRAKSKTWYAFAHENALRIGDRAAIGALMYNRAAFGLARARVERALEPLLEQGNAIAHAAIELESAHAFENAIRVVALPHLVPLTRARLMIVRQEYASALQLLESVLIDIEESESRPNKSHVLGDIAYCCAMVGDIGRTREIAQEMLLSNQADVDIDDRVVVLAQLLEVLISDRDRDLAQRLSRQFANASAEYRQNVADLRRVLGVIESRRLPKK